MKKITAAIIDDEKEARILLKTLLSKYEFIDIILTSDNAEQAVLSIMKNPPDIIFLDIHMPNKDGFELVKEIHQIHIQSQIIFVTAYNSYAIKAIKVGAFDYLLKPIDPDELEDTLIRYRQKSKENSDFKKLRETLDTFRIPRRIKLDNKHGFSIINSKDILYIQHEEQEVHFFMKNGNRDIFEVDVSLVKSKLPEKEFIDINESTMVNGEYLTHLDTSKRECQLTFDDNRINLKCSGSKLSDIEKVLNDQTL